MFANFYVNKYKLEENKILLWDSNNMLVESITVILFQINALSETFFDIFVDILVTTPPALYR